LKLASDFWTSKTVWTAVGAIIAAVSGAVTHHITWQEAAAAIFAAIQTVNLRDALAKAHE
jgi:uncharacterized membrane protein YhaH (DUF805 family)